MATDIYEETKDLKLLQSAGGWASPDVPLKYYAQGRSSSSAATTAVRSLYHKKKEEEIRNVDQAGEKAQMNKK